MMHRPLAHVLYVALATALGVAGCRTHHGKDFKACGPTRDYEQVVADIDYPATSACTDRYSEGALVSIKPWSLGEKVQPEFVDIELDEVIYLAMSNSRVLRGLGGTVVRAPEATETQFDPAIQETDPRFGVEAALSNFDAEFSSEVFFDKNDRQLNNLFFGGGIRQFSQDLMNWDTEISKLAVTGSEFVIRHHIDYDANDAPANAFPSAFYAWIEGEIRHPLLQGGGTQFNRISGRSRIPGLYNGVLIARLNTDVQLTDFEIAVRDLVSNIENVYWDLYFAYRDLDAKIAARDAALGTWRRIHALYLEGRRGGEAEKESQAREQFYRFQEEVQNALSGRLADGTRTNNGSIGGTFRGNGGVYVTERRLRLLMGLPSTDGKLLRPAHDPVICQIDFDWDQISHEARTRRAELRRQKWQIRRRELELIASKNYLLPQLDAVGLYRWRGFGKHLFGAVDVTPPVVGDPVSGASAYDQLVGGNYQEWQLGVEFSLPIGFRRAHTGVRNAELWLARERAILKEQIQEVVYEAAGSVAEVDRAYFVSQTSYNRLVAGKEELVAVEAKFVENKASLNLLLDAQKRLAAAESQYYRTLAEYAVATKNVHFTKGTLLEFAGVFLAEGPWPSKAHADACRRESRRCHPRQLNYISARAPIVSLGTYDQTPGCKLPAAGPEVINPGFETPVQPDVETNRVEPVPADGFTLKGLELVPAPDGSTAGSGATGFTPK